MIHSHVAQNIPLCREEVTRACFKQKWMWVRFRLVSSPEECGQRSCPQNSLGLQHGQKQAGQGAGQRRGKARPCCPSGAMVMWQPRVEPWLSGDSTATPTARGAAGVSRLLGGWEQSGRGSCLQSLPYTSCSFPCQPDRLSEREHSRQGLSDSCQSYWLQGLQREGKQLLCVRECPLPISPARKPPPGLAPRAGSHWVHSFPFKSLLNTDLFCSCFLL